MNEYISLQHKPLILPTTHILNMKVAVILVALCAGLQQISAGDFNKFGRYDSKFGHERRGIFRRGFGGQSGIGFDQLGRGLDQLGNGFNKGGFGKGFGGFDQLGRGLDQLGNRFNKGGFGRGFGGFDQPKSGVNIRSFDERIAGFDGLG